jgi:hypothetical protein
MNMLRIENEAYLVEPQPRLTRSHLPIIRITQIAICSPLIPRRLSVPIKIEV